jgi:hypothetical protein
MASKPKQPAGPPMTLGNSQATNSNLSGKQTHIVIGGVASKNPADGETPISRCGDEMMRSIPLSAALRHTSSSRTG